MKLITKFILIAVALLGLTFNLSAAEPEKTNKTGSTSDQFLSFVLSKAEKYSENVESGLGKAVDIISEETPKVIEEFLTWRAWKAGIIGFGCLAIVIILGGGGLFLVLKNDLWEISPVFMFLIFPIFFAVQYTLEFVQIMVAPRVYIIEQALQLVK